ncbi:hypothetical protein PsorP6_006436 [Peronosclerospora sorghi]|uniref:Uncharacterized protein n=1 Tax=Peronosclerospora sorghi TaxID=230839 RepID=A0ACC0W4Z9_9STRA|nr:hypothetical protein PsorP6_006436 [Peronosclerospora sorghi]
MKRSEHDLIRKLLEIDPDKQPSAEQALQHPWLRNLRASILAVLLIDTMTENLDEDEKQELKSAKRSFAWGLSSSVEALNEKTSALLSTLHYFDKEGK